jgi:hypothetical protein
MERPSTPRLNESRPLYHRRAAPNLARFTRQTELTVSSTRPRKSSSSVWATKLRLLGITLGCASPGYRPNLENRYKLLPFYACHRITPLGRGEVQMYRCQERLLGWPFPQSRQGRNNRSPARKCRETGIKVPESRQGRHRSSACRFNNRSNSSAELIL